MYDQRSTGLGGPISPTDRPLSRIETQTESIKAITNRLNQLVELNVQHARQLGYFEPPKDSTTGVSPVVTSLDDAIRELERAVNNLDGSMNLFS